ncbi:MAG: hypothetical protein RL014_892, partial [Pseudomonadota bacterium]
HALFLRITDIRLLYRDVNDLLSRNQRLKV